MRTPITAIIASALALTLAWSCNDQVPPIFYAPTPDSDEGLGGLLDWEGGWTPQGEWDAEGDPEDWSGDGGGDGGYKGDSWPCLICEDTDGADQVPPPPEPVVLYLSADDSNSQSSPVIARELIGNGDLVPASRIRIWEFLNYYDFSYLPPSGQALRIEQQLRPYDFDEGIYALQVGIQGRHLAGERRPLNLTLSLDTSGSMGGVAIENLKATCRAIAGSLQEGDTISMVTWANFQDVPLDSLVVDGPDDPSLLAAIDGLIATGGTNLYGGLTTAYALAAANFIDGGMNRVVLISDGGANVGVTEEEIIAGAAEDAEGEQIFLIGVGVSSSGVEYNDLLMDTVTDWGKGAAVYIDSPAEAERMFGERFLATVEVVAQDVQVAISLPPDFEMYEFLGEEYSADAAEVEPQHLAPNDAMIFQQLIRTAEPDEVYGGYEIRLDVEFHDPLYGTSPTISDTATLQELIDAPCDELRKGDAVVVYAQTLGKVYDKLGEADAVGAVAECAGGLDIVAESAAVLGDPDLEEIVELLGTYCENVADTYL